MTTHVESCVLSEKKQRDPHKMEGWIFGTEGRREDIKRRTTNHISEDGGVSPCCNETFPDSHSPVGGDRLHKPPVALQSAMSTSWMPLGGAPRSFVVASITTSSLESKRKEHDCGRNLGNRRICGPTISSSSLTPTRASVIPKSGPGACPHLFGSSLLVPTYMAV